MKQLQCGDQILDLTMPNVMGILNVTPDSFSDGGRLYKDGNLAASGILEKATHMIEQGVAILDVGGESTRPGAPEVSEQEEMDRVLPAIELLKSHFDTPISIDTSNANIMLESARLGVGLINDVRALERDGALQAAATTGLPVCLMHMKGTPETMQNAPQYSSVTSEVQKYLQKRIDQCLSSGVKADNIILDPGIGFGKSLAHNLALIREIDQFIGMGYPVLLGVSRKSMFEQLLGRSVDERLAGGLATTAYAVMQGVSLIRVHDVQETVDVIKVLQALKGEGA